MKLISRLSNAAMLATMLSGCVIAPIPIDNLSYKGVAKVRTDKTASILITSSGIGGINSTTLMPAGGILIPMAQKSNGKVFESDSQQEFAASLKKELLRLGIVKDITSNTVEKADIMIAINIDRARFNGDRVEFLLDISMLVSGATSPSLHRYKVVSTEGDSLLDLYNTNGAEARVKLAQKMLDRLIPDIEAYALTLPPG